MYVAARLPVSCDPQALYGFVDVLRRNNGYLYGNSPIPVWRVQGFTVWLRLYRSQLHFGCFLVREWKDREGSLVPRPYRDLGMRLEED